jgi:hypothetical protein
VHGDPCTGKKSDDRRAHPDPFGQVVLFYAKYCSSPDKPRPVKPEHFLLALLLVVPKLFQVLLTIESNEIITSLT